MAFLVMEIREDQLYSFCLRGCRVGEIRLRPGLGPSLLPLLILCSNVGTTSAAVTAVLQVEFNLLWRRLILDINRL